MAGHYLAATLLSSLLAHSAFAAPLSIPALPFGLSSVPSLIPSPVPSCSYPVKAANGSTVNFANHVSFDFTSLQSLPSFFNVQNNLIVPSVSPYCYREFDASNVALDRHGLSLTVPGGQVCDGTTLIQGAEIVSNISDIFYASVRTVAEVSNVPGTINAAFFYADDSNEIDIEMQTSSPGQIQVTNQAHQNVSTSSTYSIKNPAWFPTSSYHEYRYDWYSGVNGAANVTFFVDGTLIKSISVNTPQYPGSLFWNNWSNGGSWTLGPPATNNVYRIASIEAFYNRTSGATTCPVTVLSSASKTHPKVSGH